MLLLMFLITYWTYPICVVTLDGISLSVPGKVHGKILIEKCIFQRIKLQKNRERYYIDQIFNLTITIENMLVKEKMLHY